MNSIINLEFYKVFLTELCLYICIVENKLLEYSVYRQRLFNLPPPCLHLNLYHLTLYVLIGGDKNCCLP